MRITISGSREYPAECESIIESTVENLIVEDIVEEIMVGGARGTDTVALRTAYQARESTEQPTLHVVIPFTLNQQPKEAVNAIKQFADTLTELDYPKNPGSYHRRNSYMLKQSDKLIAFWNGQSSGTKQTIDKANDLDMPVDIKHLTKAGNES